MSQHIGTVSAEGADDTQVATSSAGVEVFAPTCDITTYSSNRARALAALLVVAADAHDRGERASQKHPTDHE